MRTEEVGCLPLNKLNMALLELVEREVTGSVCAYLGKPKKILTLLRKESSQSDGSDRTTCAALGTWEKEPDEDRPVL